MRSPIVIAAVVSLALGCVHATAFRPALAEQSVPGRPETAAAEAAGVRMTARAGGWDGWPKNLEDRLTPVEVTIENHSGKTLRIRHQEFRLVAPNGFRYTAMSPGDVQNAAAVLASDYYGVAWSASIYGGPFWPWGWYGSPWYGPWFGIGVYPYAYGPWPPYSASSVPQPGPQGALQDGGHVTVQLFFPVPARSLPQLELVADLVDDKTGDRFGTVRIPFLRQE